MKESPHNNPETINSQEKIQEVIEETKKGVDILIEQAKQTKFYNQLSGYAAADPDDTYCKGKLRDLEEGIEEGENAFVNKVLSTAYEAKEKFPKGIALFDIDETLVKSATQGGNIATGPDKYNTVVRPAALPVLGALRDLGFKIGFITSRGPREGLIDEALNDERNLLALKEMIDPEYINSTDDKWILERMVQEGIRHVSDPAKMDKAYQYFLDKGVVRKNIEDDDKGTITSSGYFQKCMIVADVKSKLDPDTALLVVDDAAYASLLDQENGVYGVELFYRKEDGGGAFTLDSQFVPMD